MEYDARGNVTEYIDGRKTKFVREYTKTYLLKSEEVFTVKEDDNNYKSTPDASRSYAYDEGGSLKQVTEGSSSIFYNEKDGSYQSDAYGNIRSMKWSSTGLEMSYEYDNLNRMTSVITPDGKEVAYTYNMNNQVTSLTRYINESITYSKAKISEYTLLNGIKKSFEYNDLGVTSSLKYNKDSKISTGFSYTYDDNFNIKTRTSLDTKKLSSFGYDQANRLTNSYMEGEFQTKSPEPITISNFSYINGDLVGAKQELVKYEALPEKIIFDTSARSYVYDFNGTKEIRAIELYPESKVHRVRERDVHIYVKENTEDVWKEVRNWKFNKDENNGKLSFVFKETVSAGYVKVRSSWDDRNKENVCIDDYSTFKGNPNNLLRIWTLENTLTEEYSYDGNSNRISFVENGNLSSYEYYKNKQGGNTAKVKYDGKWYYTYDSNGNRTSRAKALISGVADKNKEYWTYEWDLWNRLVKVVQYNAPDNGECVEVSYEYDALNHRITRTSKGETTKYAYGRNGALAYQEKTKDGSVTKRSFTYLNNEIVGFTDKTNAEEEKLFYTVTDIQGSITEVYDGSSKLVWKSGYTAFGQLAGEVVDLIDFDGMYTGCDYDSATGLTYHWNRWRSEDGSCFISEDPARDGANWYGYAGCNPIVYVDPTGLAPYINGIYDGDYNPDYNPGVPVEGPKTNPNGMPEDVSPNLSQTNSNLYHYAGNNPVCYVDSDGRTLLSEFIAWLKHPIAASKVGRASDGGTNISSIATNFTINLGLSWANYGNGRKDEGSSRGAFRHALWQALITKSFDYETALDIGKGHDPNIPEYKNSYDKLSDADTIADTLNNIIGRSIGINSNKSNTEITEDVLNFQYELGLYNVKKNEDGTYSVCLTKLSNEEYNSAMKKLSNLNDNGMNK